MKNNLIRLLLCIMLPVSACEAQNKKTAVNESENNNNPLLCDPRKGVCEKPGVAGSGLAAAQKTAGPLLRVVYFTDPICSACWSIEPQLRRLMLEYGHQLNIEYHMGGLLPSWEGFNGGGISKPSDVAHHWEEMSHYFDMPIDGDVWLTDPLSSSYPAGIAFKAAQLQGDSKAADFLRRVKEMVFLEKKNIARWEHLMQAASECGLDTARLALDIKGPAAAAFRDDLALAARYGVRGFPAIYISDSLNNQASIYGYRPYQDFEQALKQLVPAISKKSYRQEGDHLFIHYPTLTTREFSELTGLSKEAALASLAALEKQGLISAYKSKNGILWKKKG